MKLHTRMTDSDEVTYEFQAEINQLLSLIINTFYSDKDVFLRELISNASDAIDKARILAVRDGTARDGDEIRIRVDGNSIVVQDTGIGMTSRELVENLGTIAHSGTQKFVQCSHDGNKDDISNLIGQFGVGFYSAYLVSDEVIVETHKNDETLVWKSDAKGSFTIRNLNDDNDTLARGTRITLRVKESANEYLDVDRLKSLVEKHSQFISYPIFIEVPKTREVPIEDETEGDQKEDVKAEDDKAEDDKAEDDKAEDDKAEDDKAEDDKAEDDKAEDDKAEDDKAEDDKAEDDKAEDDKAEDDKADDNKGEDDTIDENRVEIEDVTNEPTEDKETDDAKEPKTRTEHYKEWELQNKHKPLWIRAPKSVTIDEYNEFYKLMTRDWDNSLMHKHFHAEGNLEFQALLYIPKRAGYDLFDANHKPDIRLHVKRVLVQDRFDELVPDWLKFVKGVVDSNDLPLNISRESLQKNQIVKSMRNTIVKKMVELLLDTARDEPETYMEFYKNYSKSLKIAIPEDSKNKEKLLELLRYPTEVGGAQISLKEYVSKIDDKKIYYMSGESDEMIDQSPFLESLKKSGTPVLYMSDPIDEYLMQSVKEYGEYNFVCCTRDDVVAVDDEVKAATKSLTERFKSVLTNQVNDVTVGARMVDSPCCLVSGPYGYSANMERIMKAQTLRDSANASYMSAPKIMEINPEHRIIKALMRMVEAEGGDQNESNRAVVDDVIHLLFESSLVDSGFSIATPKRFVKRINNLINISLSLEVDEIAEDDPKVKIEKIDDPAELASIKTNPMCEQVNDVDMETVD